MCVALQILTTPRPPGFSGFVLKNTEPENTAAGLSQSRNRNLDAFSHMRSGRFGWAHGAFALDVILIWDFSVALVERNVHYSKSLTQKYNSNFRTVRSKRELKKGKVTIQKGHLQSHSPALTVTQRSWVSLPTNRSSVDCILYLINQIIVQLVRLCYLGPAISR